MGKDSKIEWTHHTFNPWTGCKKVSPACANCYAVNTPPVRMARSRGLELWGDTSRMVASETMWKQPLAWDRAAEKAGQRHRVFCASLADVFEDFTGNVVTNDEKAYPGGLEVARKRLFSLIQSTPSLDWLLLTKRPENISQMVPGWCSMTGNWPKNIWVGTTVENQDVANKRLPYLMRLTAKVLFVSMEPLLGNVNLDYINTGNMCWMDVINGMEATYVSQNSCRPLDWVIVGGESGKNSRITHIDWIRNIRRLCSQGNIPFFYKQHGDWCEFSQLPDGALWELDREPTVTMADGHNSYHNVGKKLAGRTLDGHIHSELPCVS